MKKLKKNHIITPILILLTGFLVTLGGIAFFKTLPTKTPREPIGVMPETSNPSPDNSEDHTFCKRETFENKSYIVCSVDPSKLKIALFLNDAANRPFKYFRNIEKMLQTRGQTLAFAVNGGMYHKDYSAVGLYVENGKELHPLSTKDGPGNFHMKPNGVFFIRNDKAAILDTEAFKKISFMPDLATQSGPMLVINNAIHPRFIPNSPYLEYRNGVGVREDGTVVFVNSEMKVNFDELARFFRDSLKTPNALFLDGSISSLYAPEMKRYDWWYGLGPIIGVVIPADEKPNDIDTDK